MGKSMQIFIAFVGLVVAGFKPLFYIGGALAFFKYYLHG